MFDIGYIEVLEKHKDVIYPAAGLAALVLLSMGIVQTLMRSKEPRGLERAEFKKKVMQELQRHFAGTTLEPLAKAVGLKPAIAGALLKDMQEEGLITSREDGESVTKWSVKGAGTSG